MTPTERALQAGRPIWRGTHQRTFVDCKTRKLLTRGCAPMEVPVNIRHDAANLYRCTAAGVLCCSTTCRRLHGVRA
jgi:hypothetical protein